MDRFPEFGSLVNIPAMSDGHHQHQKCPIPDLAKNAVIADPVTPQSTQVCLEASSETARITFTRNPFVEVGDDVALSVTAELAQFLQCSFTKIIGPTPFAST